MSRTKINADSAAWQLQTWAAFLIALGSTSIGIYLLKTDLSTKAFLGLGLWFTVSSCFTLAKQLRDKHESEKITGQLDEAKTEAILRDFAVREREAA